MNNDSLKEQKSTVMGMLLSEIRDIAYLISWSWWEKWKAYVAVDLPEDMIGKSNSPEHINNNQLITFLYILTTYVDLLNHRRGLLN